MPYPNTFSSDVVDPSVLDLAGRSCARLTSPGEVARRLAERDEQYIRSNFVPLDELSRDRPGGASAVRRDIAAGLLPQPAYRLDDGVDYVARDYFELVDGAGSVTELPAMFRQRFQRAARHAGMSETDDAAHTAWDDYLSGGYAVCLKEVTPETIVRKWALLTTLDQLLADPRPEDRDWCDRLRGAVDDLASIERPGAVLDPPRWGGPMSPQWYGSYLRSRFPAAFAPAAAVAP